MDLAARRREHYGRIPAWYSGRLHMLAQNLLALGVVLPALGLARGASAYQWLLAPATLVLANWIEWALHRGPLHHRWPGLERLYVAHTVCHHAVFDEHAMATEHDRELAYVLFPVWFVPVAAVLLAPAGWLLHRLSPPLAGIFYASGFVYFLMYEWLHLLHHSAPRGPVAGSALACWLRRHHARHHDPHRMQQGNFNISVPLFDHLLRTVLPESPATGAPPPR